METMRKLVGFKSQQEINGSILGRTPDILGRISMSQTSLEH